MSAHQPLPTPVPRVVLDNNTVLDWLLFRDPAGLAVGAAVVGGRLHWTGTEAMRAELAHVLARGELDRWQPDLAAILAGWSRHCSEVPAPEIGLADAGRFRCTDPDDQKFIDLAVSQQARWLLTRDRAVLKLARRLRAVGVEVLTPDAWVTAHVASTTPATD